MDESDNCAICLEEMTLTNSDGSPILLELYTLKCAHKFHKECISRWLLEQTICPLCRTNVDPIRQYVDDGIISEERRQELIELMKSLIGGVGMLAETLFPSHLNGFSQVLDQSINQGEYDEVVSEIANKYSDMSLNQDRDQSNGQEIALVARMIGDIALYGLGLSD